MFKKTIKVSAPDLDALQHVNNVRYVQWVQEIAAEHWHTKATQEMKNKWLWVVTKHEINYHKPAHKHNTLNVQTYIKQTKGPIAIRVVNFLIEGLPTPIVVSETTWCLLDALTNKPKRIPENVVKVF